MQLQHIKNFLTSKPGYLKKSPYTLANIFGQENLELCQQALKEVKLELRENIVKEQFNEGKILIYDLETSPNVGWFWRAGYKQTINPNQIIKERAIICISYKWLGEDTVYNLTWDKNQCDKFLIQQFVEVLNEADLIVAHNGDRFDIKWFKTRALYYRIPTLPNYKQFDTLKIAKSKLYLNSNRLDYIAKYLGFEGKIVTTPDLWHKVVTLNDRLALNDMLNYCDEDVRQLENVYNELKYLDNPRIHVGVLNNKSKITSPITGDMNIVLVKTVTTNTGTIKRIMKDLDTNRIFEMSNTNYLKYLEEK